MGLIGVDGCPSGWVVAECELPAAGALPLPSPRFRIVRTFGELLASLAWQQALVCIDIPIGLPGGQPRDDGRRLVDRAARQFLGGRRASSVFSAPCRPTLHVDTYLAACASELAARGTKLSRQAFAITPKIREVDDAITPAHQQPLDDAAVVRVREVHPEVTFAALRGRGEPGSGLVSRKRTPDGEAERLALLQPYVPDLDPGAVRRSVSGAQRDDIVDAVACLVTAYRIARGEAFSLPRDAVQLDERGLRMEIVG